MRGRMRTMLLAGLIALCNTIAPADNASGQAHRAAPSPPTALPAGAASPQSQSPRAAGARPATRTITMVVTAYCPCTKCCGPNAKGVTASGVAISKAPRHFVAADPAILRFGQKVLVPGYCDHPAPVLDTGSAIKGNRLDVFFPTHQEAKNWGVRTIQVQVSL